MRCSLVFILCAVGASALAVADKERPVAKVVRMLNDMKAQLEKEAQEDEEVMDKMVCWCTTNDQEKTLAIKTNTAKISQLEEAIVEYDAKSQTLAKEVSQLEKDVSGNKQELLEATTMRDKDLADFVQQEKEQIVSIQGVTDALSALTKKVPGLSMRQESLLQVQNALKKRSESDRKKVQSFLETKSHLKAPASSEILGILKQMKDDFEASLKEARQEEKSAVKAYEELKGAKEGEMAAATDQKNAKDAQNAETMEKLADAKTDLKDTEATLEADTEFLADLKVKCANMDAEFAARKKVRAEEIKAVGEALSILTSDESRDAFGKTGSFMQLSSHTVLVGTESSTTLTKAMARARRSASRVLLTTALKLGSPQLATLAIRMQRMDVFGKVKQAIDELVVQLKKENKDEIKQRDWCVKELNQNARQTDAAYHSQHKLQTQHDEYDLLLKNGNDEIAANKAAVAEMQVQMKKASENRAQENADFQVTIQDARATQEILTKALDKLTTFYDPHRAAPSLVQQPGGFKKYKKSGGAQGVMGMIEEIIMESKAVESDAILDEQDAQAAYEGFIKDTNKSIRTLKEAIQAKSEAVAKADSSIAQVKADLLATMGTLEELHEYVSTVHTQCDFTLQQFDVRQKARSTEIDALNEAKGILSGAR